MAVCASGLHGQTASLPNLGVGAGIGDAFGLQIVDYQPNAVIELAVKSGHVTTIAFGADEEIESVAIGDASAWQATPSKSGTHLFLKPLATGDTNMTVVTNTRDYMFELRVAANGPYLVKFRYPLAQTAGASPPAPSAIVGRYHLSGVKALRPKSMSDDGTHVYIEWPPDKALPATYSVDEGGGRTLLNGAMRAGLYVVDSINAHLEFRRDRDSAFADRMLSQPARARR